MGDFVHVVRGDPPLPGEGGAETSEDLVSEDEAMGEAFSGGDGGDGGDGEDGGINGDSAKGSAVGSAEGAAEARLAATAAAALSEGAWVRAHVGVAWPALEAVARCLEMVARREARTGQRYDWVVRVSPHSQPHTPAPPYPFTTSPPHRLAASLPHHLTTSRPYPLTINTPPPAPCPPLFLQPPVEAPGNAFTRPDTHRFHSFSRVQARFMAKCPT